ncbi:hypothetical protein RSAG8_10059, partial [Rhizoctonia solani AG-8 WAC10335]
MTRVKALAKPLLCDSASSGARHTMRSGSKGQSKGMQAAPEH